MKLHARIVAGTALGVLMASAPGWADQRPAAGTDSAEPILLAQADVRPVEENPPAADEEDEDAPEGDQPAPSAVQPPAPVPETAPQRPPSEAPQPETAPEPADADDAGQQDEPVTDVPEAAPPPQAGPEAAPEPEQPAAAQEPAADAPAVQPPPAEPAPQGQAAPAPEADTDQPAVEEPTPATPEPQRPVTGGGDPAPTDQPAPSPESDGEAPSPETDADAPAPADQPSDAPENAAPIFDSAKQPAGADGEQPIGADAPDGQPVQPDGQAVEPVGPPPTTDAEAQADQPVPADIEPITATEGRRMDPEQFRRDRRERPQGAEVLREIGERVIFQLGGEAFVAGNDRRRLEMNAEEVYYDELPRGRVRETIVRPNGVQIVTVYNRHGDIVRRSRVMPDGREVILTYVDERNYDREREWRDPGRDLPPLRVAIPYREYILDAGRVDDPERYYEFLDQPPVERVRQLYSVEDVKRSARLRDTVRRVDLDTITFATGSAEISQSQVAELEAIASAMVRMLDRNPAETFLIEGHTDAVGSDVSNLALSDARAEGVANALTRYYDVPPENLVTQGYGERYLKIATDGPSRENRRVAIRRITPLVTPIASAQ